LVCFYVQLYNAKKRKLKRRVTRMGELIKQIYFVSFFYMFIDCLTYYYGDGSQFIGDVDSNGKPKQGVLYNSNKGVSGKSDMVMQYNGSFRDGVYHGNGSWYGQDGHSYQGQFNHGQANGQGVWTTKKGERIEGQFLNHTVHGEAVWSYPSLGEGWRMKGEFKRGHAHGKGVMYYGPETRFEGTFKKGYPHGQGQLISANNTIIWSGNINNGWPEGEISQRVKDLFGYFHQHPLRNAYRGNVRWVQG